MHYISEMYFDDTLPVSVRFPLKALKDDDFCINILADHQLVPKYFDEIKSVNGTLVKVIIKDTETGSSETCDLLDAIGKSGILYITIRNKSGSNVTLLQFDILDESEFKRIRAKCCLFCN